MGTSVEARLAADRLKESHLYYLLGKYSYHVQKYRQAIQLWNRVSKLSSMYPQARYFRGVAFLEIGDLKQALKAFQEVKGLDLEILKRSELRCLAVLGLGAPTTGRRRLAPLPRSGFGRRSEPAAIIQRV